MKQARGSLAAGVVLALVAAAPVHAQTTLGASAQRLFIDRCSQCHDDGDNPAPNANAGARPAPQLAEIRMRQSPDAVYRLIPSCQSLGPHNRIRYPATPQCARPSTD